MIPCSRIYFLVDTLEYLAKSGRIRGVTALFGSVLKIKPILALSEGRVEQYEKERTQNHAINRLFELVISQAAIPEQAHEFADRLCAEFGLNSIPLLDIPPAIVVHGGPGILAAAFFTDGK